MGNISKTQHRKTKRVCEVCGEEFLATSAKICSKRCSSNLLRKRALETGKYQYQCRYCGKDFKRCRPENSQGDPHKYCSTACSRHSKVDKMLAVPRINYEGYVMVECRAHPNAIQGRVREHRLVVEKVIGRYLDKSEIVHHIDGNRQNNDPVNLMITDHQNHSSCTSKHRKRYRVSEEFIRSIGKWEEYLRYVSN